jgi:hypothetical protein
MLIKNLKKNNTRGQIYFKSILRAGRRAQVARAPA